MAEIKHGSPSSYNNHKCRCQECKDAWAKYMYPRIKKNRAAKKKAEEPAKPINIKF